MPIANMPSVMERGILSHRRVRKLAHQSVANDEVQARRARVRVPGGRPLHEYANLYFHARNPMMYVRQDQHADLCVISVSTDVLDLPGTVVSDRNASVDFVRFAPAPDGLEIVDQELTFARSWNHSDPIEKTRRKQAKQAEVLVEDLVEPRFIRGAYVSCAGAEKQLAELAPTCRTKRRAYLFFR